ncbi:MAG TPA: alpha/beta fold hydrolase [Geminicoccaceae bacterium]|nr:alpha/beta fold hydrolase [Geminicoccaceae bacterium]
MSTTLTGPMEGPRAGGPPRQLVVLLHGVGADGGDLIALAPALGEALPRAAFVAPDAPFPCDMAPYGRQWFSLRDRSPAALLAGARAAAPILNAFLDSELARHRLEDRHLALVGFSQGTMMALYTALRRPRACAGVVGYSGALIGAEALPTEARSRPPVLLIHGDADEIVPAAALDLAVQGLRAAEISVQWRLRPGLPHAIDPDGIACGAAFLQAAFADTAGRAPFHSA